MRFSEAAYSILRGMFMGKKNKGADKRAVFRGSWAQTSLSKQTWQGLW